VPVLPHGSPCRFSLREPDSNVSASPVHGLDGLRRLTGLFT
jgi:hypothetical protein